MKNTRNLVIPALALLLSACASAPEAIEELVAARSAVSQLEASPRAGVAATNISEARQALNRANQLADSGGSVRDIKYQASIANKNAQIATERILTAHAKEEIDRAGVERQAVLLEARERQAQHAAERARASTQRAESLNQRAQSLEQELAELKAKKTDRGMVVTLGDVLFATDEATLKPGAYATLDRVGDLLKESGDRRVLIEGHTDNVGSAEYNQELSARRAAAVQGALLDRGVPSKQIMTLGRGESMPLASNDSIGGRQQNRRVEMVFQDVAEASDSG